MGNILRLAVLGAMLGAGGSAVAAGAPIAGITPFERPAGAPVVTTYEKTGEWYRRALTGISRPYPGSLRFLEHQGRWHTPFNRPGMTGPYDIRGWHRSAAAASAR